MHRLPRLTDWLLFAAMLLFVIWYLAPQELPVILLKLTLVALAGVAGYWLDRGLFPYGRPDKLFGRSPDVAPQQLIAAAFLRRAIIVAAVLLAIALGL